MGLYAAVQPNFNEKAMELLKEYVNISGMYDMNDTFSAAVIIQFMTLEIHMSSRVETSEILALATTKFSKTIVDHAGAELLVQDFQTCLNLIDLSSSNG